MSNQVLFPDDTLRRYEMPGGRPAVAIRRLATDERGASWSAVRFPPGFRRPQPGWYPADEEFLVLDGAISVSGVVHAAGGYAFLPAGYLRIDTFSNRGALAVAWFSDRPIWREDTKSDAAYRPDLVLHGGADDWPVIAGPFGDGRSVRLSASTRVMDPRWPPRRNGSITRGIDRLRREGLHPPTPR